MKSLPTFTKRADWKPDGLEFKKSEWWVANLGTVCRLISFLQILFREDVLTTSPPNARIFRFKTLIDGTVGRDYIQISQGVYRNSGIWQNTKGTSTAKTRKLSSRVLCLLRLLRPV